MNIQESNTIKEALDYQFDVLDRLREEEYDGNWSSDYDRVVKETCKAMITDFQSVHMVYKLNLNINSSTTRARPEKYPIPGHEKVLEEIEKIVKEASNVYESKNRH